MTIDLPGSAGARALAALPKPWNFLDRRYSQRRSKIILEKTCSNVASGLATVS
jgi:hypothetical protein